MIKDKRNSVKAGNYLLILLTVFLMIAGIEGAARIYFRVTRGSSTIGLPERKQYLWYRPFVMFGPDWDSKLKASKYARDNGGQRPYRIVILGGSTAAHFPGHILEDAFARRFPDREFEVINTGKGGYNARQEVIVGALWVVPLRPDMLITLDGANDLIHRIRMEESGTFYLNRAYKTAVTRPFIACLMHVLRHSQFVHGLTRLKARISIGPAGKYEDAIPVFLSAQHSITVLAKGMGALRVMVLQPFMSFKEPLSDSERGFSHYKYREDVMKELYVALDRGMEDLSEKDGIKYIDGRRAFNGIERTIFSDDVHFTGDEGYEILARYIAGSFTEEDLKKAD